MGAAECCTPALLLESGDAWELERCNCVASQDVDCGGEDSGRLLQGFVRWRCALVSHAESRVRGLGADLLRWFCLCPAQHRNQHC